MAIYDSTIQLGGEDEQLWAISTHNNAGAYRIVVEALPDWAVGTNVVLSGSALHAGGDRIEWDESALWDPRIMRRELTTEERCVAVKQIAEFLYGCEIPDAIEFWNSLAEMWNPLTQALGERDSALLCTLMARLIGRGPGLTPTGDDFLQALLVTLASGDARDRQVFEFVNPSIELLLARTTAVSRAFLYEALQGYAFGVLKELLVALPDLRSSHLARLFDIGATSGAAFVLGVLFALEYRF